MRQKPLFPKKNDPLDWKALPKRIQYCLAAACLFSLLGIFLGSSMLLRQGSRFIMMTAIAAFVFASYGAAITGLETCRKRINYQTTAIMAVVWFLVFLIAAILAGSALNHAACGH